MKSKAQLKGKMFTWYKFTFVLNVVTLSFSTIVLPQQHNEYNHFLSSEQTVQGFHQWHCWVRKVFSPLLQDPRWWTHSLVQENTSLYSHLRWPHFQFLSRDLKVFCLPLVLGILWPGCILSPELQKQNGKDVMIIKSIYSIIISRPVRTIRRVTYLTNLEELWKWERIISAFKWNRPKE